MKPPFIETLRDPHEIQKLGLDLVNSIKENYFTILYSQFISPSGRNGFIQQLKDVASQKDIKIRILSHINNETSSCSYKNGTQAVEIFNAKWACIDRVVGVAISNTATNGPVEV